MQTGLFCDETNMKVNHLHCMSTLRKYSHPCLQCDLSLYMFCWGDSWLFRHFARFTHQDFLSYAHKDKRWHVFAEHAQADDCTNMFVKVYWPWACHTNWKQICKNATGMTKKRNYPVTSTVCLKTKQKCSGIFHISLYRLWLSLHSVVLQFTHE